MLPNSTLPGGRDKGEADGVGSKQLGSQIGTDFFVSTATITII